MNQLFEFAVSSSDSVTEAYNKLWNASAGFSMMSVGDMINTQRNYMYNIQSPITAKLIEFLILEGRLPLYDPCIIHDIFNRHTQLYHNMWRNNALGIIYYETCDYEDASNVSDSEVNFLIGMIDNRDMLANYIESSIDHWIDRNECIMNLNSNVKLYIDGLNKSIPLSTLPGFKHNSLSREMMDMIRDGFLYEEFTIKGSHEPLNLIRNPKLHSDMIFYLSGLHQYYNEFMFKHPYYYSIEEFINTIMDDIESGIKYGVLEYYLDDLDRKSAHYDKEVDAIMYVRLTSIINRG